MHDGMEKYGMSDGSARSILITDDDPRNRKAMIMHLQQLPFLFEIDEATDGENAVELVREKILSTHKNYQYIIMDYQMPIINGQQATRMIREIEQNHNVNHDDRSFIITWSASKSTPYHGADAILTKPIIPSEIKMLFA